MIATNKIYKNLTELFGERKVEIDTLTLIAFGNFHNQRSDSMVIIFFMKIFIGQNIISFVQGV